MKVRIYSQTGRPINLEMAKQYEEDFKVSYDVLWAEYEDKTMSLDDFKVQLGKVDKALSIKYPIYELIDLPVSGKQWKNIQIKYGCPVTVAIAEDTKKVTLFLMDSQY